MKIHGQDPVSFQDVKVTFFFNLCNLQQIIICIKWSFYLKATYDILNQVFAVICSELILKSLATETMMGLMIYTVEHFNAVSLVFSLEAFVQIEN